MAPSVAVRSCDEMCPEGKIEVLEVRQSWQELTLEARHFSPSEGAGKVGGGRGGRGELLGVDMGWVAEPLHRVLPWLPPIWSEVHRAPVDDFEVWEDEMTADVHTLFRHDDERGWVAELEDHWPVAVERGGAPVSITALVEEGVAQRRGRMLYLDVRGASLVIHVGTQRFAARVVDRGSRVARALHRVDRPLAASAGLIGLAGLLFATVVATSVPAPRTEMIEIENGTVEKLVFIPKKKRTEVKPELEPTIDKSSPDDSRRKKHKDTDESLTPEQRDKKVAQEAGIFAGGSLDELLASDELSGDLLSSVHGLGLLSAKGHAGFGEGGLMGRGNSLSGGGVGSGIGSIDVFGGRGRPGGSAIEIERSEGGPIAAVGEVITVGALSASQVDEVVKRHLSSIKYCYQRQLPRNPSLSGKVVVRFVIASDGSVSAANPSMTSMNDGAVEQCVSGRFLRMQFPKPAGAGIVVVNYPFLFTPGG